MKSLLKLEVFMTPGTWGLKSGRGHECNIVKMHYYFYKSSSLLWLRQTQEDRFDDVHMDSYCINKLYCTFLCNC